MSRGRIMAVSCENYAKRIRISSAENALFLNVKEFGKHGYQGDVNVRFQTTPVYA